MAFPILGVLAAVVPIIERIWPDPAKAAEAKIELFKLQQSGELAQLSADLQLALGQLEINKIEAGQAGIFKGGWRPFVGWTCGGAFAWNFVLLPIANWVAIVVFGYIGKMPPSLELSVMLPVLLGMLGLGYYRSSERKAGKV